LKAPGINFLKLKYDEPLTKIGFEFNLRRYTVGAWLTTQVAAAHRWGLSATPG